MSFVARMKWHIKLLQNAGVSADKAKNVDTSVSIFFCQHPGPDSDDSFR